MNGTRRTLLPMLISPQYLNDIDHDRRNPSSEHVVQHFFQVLTSQSNWLYYLAGRFPEDVRSQQLAKYDVAKRVAAFHKGPPEDGCVRPAPALRLRAPNASLSSHSRPSDSDASQILLRHHSGNRALYLQYPSDVSSPYH